MNGKVNGDNMGIVSILKKMLIGRAFTTERGRILMFGKEDWTLYSSKALAHFFQTIGEKLGEEYLYKLSKENGRFNGEEMVAAMGAKPKGGWVTQTAITSLLDFLGYGKLEFLRSKIDTKTGAHHILLHTSENPMIEHAIKMYGKKHMLCVYWRGLLSGHGEVELGGKNLNLKENECMVDGALYCEYESKWSADSGEKS